MITSRAARIVFVAGLLGAASACYVPEQPFVISSVMIYLAVSVYIAARATITA